MGLSPLVKSLLWTIAPAAIYSLYRGWRNRPIVWGPQLFSGIDMLCVIGAQHVDPDEEST